VLGGKLQCSVNQGSAASGMGAGEPPTSCWPSSVLWMSPPISRAFLSRLRASLVSLYNPDATVRSLLCFLCFTAAVVVFACWLEFTTTPLSSAQLVLWSSSPSPSVHPEPPCSLSRHHRSSSVVIFFPRSPTSRRSDLTVSSTPWRIPSSHVSHSKYLLLL
jgi:hypothetical protein